MPPKARKKARKAAKPKINQNNAATAESEY
jgi:hypothetical protein